jgi:hypothetical protein
VPDIEIVDVTLENSGNKTAILDIKVKNVGTANTDVSAEVNIGTGADRQLVIIDPVNVNAGETQDMISSVNIPDITGYYDADITLRFADKIIRETFKLQIIQPSKPSPWFYGAIVSLIIMNIVLAGLVYKKVRKRSKTLNIRK